MEQNCPEKCFQRPCDIKYFTLSQELLTIWLTVMMRQMIPRVGNTRGNLVSFWEQATSLA